MERKDEETYFPLCEELGITYVSACPLAKGYLSNRYAAGTKYREGDAGTDCPGMGKGTERYITI